VSAIAEAPVRAERDLVLAVDDNEHNLQLLEEYLGNWGYDVVFARDGAEALALFPRVDPSIIVLDVMMPVMDGYDACFRIKQQPGGRTIPILMLTALTGADDKIRALECGADDFLNKPINKDELHTRIRSLIKIRNLRKELDSSENIILTLNYALENKDPRSGGHVQRVAGYAARLCEALGMNADERETVVKGALLHDVGMIGVPDHLLTREAFRVYFDHLRTGGLLAIHITNRYLDLYPVVDAAAQSLGKKLLLIHNVADPARQVYMADWVVVGDDSPAFRLGAATPPKIRLWTDEYSNLFRALR